MFISNGILFNHESPVRGKTFVTRKITSAVARIAASGGGVLYLGNLDAKRDWGYAPDYVKGMWLMLQQDTPDDFVLATGQTRTVRELVSEAFLHIGVDIKWIGTGVSEVGIDSNSGEVLVKVDPTYFRPLEVDILVGDYSKAKRVLNWEPVTSFKEMVSEMVSYDIKQIVGD
jgi:GDPmannose 4,6-dehydratase